jgi:hypothetical protein
MWGQRSSCYATVVGTNLLAKVHHLQSAIKGVTLTQNHPLDQLSKCIDFMGKASNKIGWFVDELNNCIDAQDIQIEQLANMVNDLVGMVEAQKKELDVCKKYIEGHHQVINTLTAKMIHLDDHVEEVQ